MKTANKLYSLNKSEVNDVSVNEHVGKSFVKSFFLSSYGALRYNQAKYGEKRDTGESFTKAWLSTMTNVAFTHYPGMAAYMDNRMARNNVK